MTTTAWILAYAVAGVVAVIGMRWAGYFDGYKTDSEAGWGALLVFIISPIWLAFLALVLFSIGVQHVGRWLRRRGPTPPSPEAD